MSRFFGGILLKLPTPSFSPFHSLTIFFLFLPRQVEELHSFTNIEICLSFTALKFKEILSV